MSNPINDGGPAFPGEAGEGGYGNSKRVATPAGDTQWITMNQGMTLRDYFAAQVMSGIAERPGESCDGYIAQRVRVAYAIADAMLAERSKQP